MRVLLVSKFLHHVGGVETYLRWLAQALDGSGHEVGLVGMTPPDGEEMMDFPDLPIWETATRTFRSGERGRTRSAATSVWSLQASRVMARAVEEFRPDVVHFHGTCYQLTPSVVHAVARRRVPTFLTVHEYKLICANQVLFDERAGQVCTDCVGASSMTKVLAPLRRRCLKGSLPVSLIGAMEGRVAEAVWRSAAPTILAPSRFMVERLLEDGWPRELVRHVDLPWAPTSELRPGLRHAPDTTRDSVTFSGRLAPVKGVDVLLRTWNSLAAQHPGVRLRVMGDGVERARLEALAAKEEIPRVDFLGQLPAHRVGDELARSIVTAHPSRSHDNSPYSVRESLLAGVPAVVSELGGMSELVGPSSGRVAAHDSEASWRAALESELRLRRAGSDALVGEVLGRAVSDETHLSVLVDAYRARTAETLFP